MNESRNQLLEEARRLVRRAFELQRRGVGAREFGEAHGFADGYMKSLLAAHLCTSSELLQLVRAERVNLDGPALRFEPMASELNHSFDSAVLLPAAAPPAPVVQERLQAVRAGLAA